jgi:hypothetical protein
LMARRLVLKHFHFYLASKKWNIMGKNEISMSITFFWLVSWLRKSETNHKRILWVKKHVMERWHCARWRCALYHFHSARYKKFWPHRNIQSTSMDVSMQKSS